MPHPDGRQAAPSRVSRAPFGALPGGELVEAITLTNRNGLQATVITYGAGLQAMRVPDRDGRFADVALGHATLQPYLDQPQFMGSTAGRVANRIAGGRFRFDGRDYQVPLNNGPNALHGGPAGIDKMIWDVLAIADDPAPSVTFGHISPDGDQGFPGTLTITATYMLTGANELCVEYRAATDAPTIVNITNHAYWNLAGEGSDEGALNHLLTIAADDFLPTDETSIPTGEFRPVEGTPFDFRRPVPIAARVRDAASEQIRFGRGYDHNWVIAREPNAEPRLHARAEHPASGRVMELLSNQPGLQFYSGNFLDGSSSGKAGKSYRMGDAIVLEAQMFPDTPNRPQFGSLRLDPGQTYRNIILFRFSVCPDKP